MFYQDILVNTEYKTSFAGEYLWDCYGAADIFDVGEDVSCVVLRDCDDARFRKVRELTVVLGGVKPYRWRAPEYIKAHNKEAKKRSINNSLAWGSTKYTEVSSEEEILDLLAKHLGTLRKETAVTVKENFTVKFDHRYVLEINAASMDQARDIAATWLTNLSRHWDSNQDVIFTDNYTIKETVERNCE